MNVILSQGYEHITVGEAMSMHEMGIHYVCNGDHKEIEVDDDFGGY